MNKKIKTYFITGTNTDIGKTFITAGLAAFFTNKGLKTAVMKPIQTGIPEYSPDITTIHSIVPQLIKLPANIATPYIFKLPASPHLAAKCKNIEINPDKIKEAYQKAITMDLDVLLIEGAGGVLVPINENYLMIDLIKDLKINTIITTSTALGTINHTLLTINALKNYEIPISGVIFNKIQEPTSIIEKDNINIIEKISKVPVLASIKDLQSEEFPSYEDILLEFNKQSNLNNL